MMCFTGQAIHVPEFDLYIDFFTWIAILVIKRCKFENSILSQLVVAFEFRH